MSAGPDPQIDTQTIEQHRLRLTRRLEEIARLCESQIPPAQFYGEVLKRLLECLAAPAGAIWTRTERGNLQLQFQVNLKEVGIDRTEEGRQAHEELLRQSVLQPRQLHLMPRSGLGPPQDGQVAPGNPTDFLLLLVPIQMTDQVMGLIEVWQAPNRPLPAIPGFLQFMALMADMATRYQRNQMIGQMTGQQQLWTQLEAFARQIHSSLHPIEVAYTVANEGRRLIDCDRVSVAIRQGPRTSIAAVSGADVVEKRSNLVRLMRTLCDRVLDWGEKLVFSGTKDDSLPPKVLEALDAYLAESPSKLLVVEPLAPERDPTEKKDKSKPKKPVRAALLMECFEPPPDAQQPVARLEVIARHATSALNNAIEYRRIPMRWVWLPLAKVQEGLGGKGRTFSAIAVVALSFLISALILVPYPLKMEATGQLVPVVRRVVCSPVPGTVKDFTVQPGDVVKEQRDLAIMFDGELQAKLTTLAEQINSSAAVAREARRQASQPGISPQDKIQREQDAVKEEAQVRAKRLELEDLIRRTSADRTAPGYYFLKAPDFSPEEALHLRRRDWTVLNGNFREELTGRGVRPSDPILRLGAKEGPWEIELKIPQKHIGQVLHAFHDMKVDELEVDFLLRSDPTRTFRGILERKKIAGEASPQRDESGEQEPVVLAFVRIEGEDIPAGQRMPRDLLLSGAEVHARIRCGDHALGYSLFYGVWEFLYEKVVFFF